MDGSTAAFDERLTTYGRLVEANRRLEAAFAPAFQRHGLSATWFEALLRLRRSRDEQLRMCELADQTSLTSGGATRLVDALSRADLVERRPDPDDRRVQLVTLTPHGRRTIDAATDEHLADLDEHLFARLAGGDSAELDRLLDLLRASEP